MNRINKINIEYQKALKYNPKNTNLYNDYAVFLHKYKKDTDSAIKYLCKAIQFEPQNIIYKSNYKKLLREKNLKNRKRYNIFLLIIAGVMVWISFNGYTNFMNILSLFLLAQIVINNQKIKIQDII